MEEKDISMSAKPVKRKRHFILAVIVIALFAVGVVLVGRKKGPVNITKDFC